jgi:hypothetical protein
MGKYDEKWVKYAGIISAALGEVLENDESDYYISKDELFEEDDTLTHFIHALANVVPTYIHNALTNNNHNQLQFNHVANQLCFQFSNSDDKIKGEKLLKSLEKIRDLNDSSLTFAIAFTAIEEYNKKEE